ncbi:zinc-ribbon domain-containing protein [Paraglaciecola arctica]|uniref:zinc-ribbon domain-containing protein n=1 Tax=Paraglaciecola arctica TaxID=1128911 RepID=UPI00129B4A3F
MAMMKCPECETQISSSASSCPRCGHPISKVKPKSTGQATLAILLGIGSCWFWFGTHMYFIFPMDSAIFGAVLLIHGVIQFSKNS